MDTKASALYEKMQQGLREVYSGLNYMIEEKEDIRRVENAKAVTLYLKGQESAQYTRLATKLEEIEALAEQLKDLKTEVKQDTRDLIEELFDIEDETKTRIVDTVSVIFTLSKKPKETVTPKYKEILEVLVNDFLPQELIDKVEKLKKTMVTTTQRAASLKTARKSTNESFYLTEFQASSFPEELAEIQGLVMELRQWLYAPLRIIDMAIQELGIDVNATVVEMGQSAHQLPAYVEPTR